MNDLSQLEVFVRVVSDGGFTAAAQTLGVSKSFVSRQISQLEDRLGARLLNRTTRKLVLTDVGAVFFERCQRILEELSDAESAVTDLQTAPRGKLRVAAPMTFGVQYVAPAVAEFLTRHPELSVDLDLSDRRVDLLGEGFDLAVRIGALPDSSLIARKLAETQLCAYASREYLDRRGRPQQPSDLRQHDGLLYAYQNTGAGWRLTGPEGEVFTSVRGRVSANNGEALAIAALAGLGIALLPDFIAAGKPCLGKLERVLPGWADVGAVWALSPHNRHVAAKVRLFVEFLAEQWSEPPWRLTTVRTPKPRERRGA